MPRRPHGLERAAANRNALAAFERPPRLMRTIAAPHVDEHAFDAILQLFGHARIRHRASEKRRTILSRHQRQVFRLLAMHDQPRAGQIQNPPRKADVIRMQMRQAQRADVGPFQTAIADRLLQRVETLFRGDTGIDQHDALVQFHQVDVDRFQLPRHGKRDGGDAGRGFRHFFKFARRSCYGVRRVIGAAHQRSAFYVTETHLQA